MEGEIIAPPSYNGNTTPRVMLTSGIHQILASSDVMRIEALETKDATMQPIRISFSHQSTAVVYFSAQVPSVRQVREIRKEIDDSI